MSQPLLAHRTDGAGTPVVLLNGGMMSFPSWELLSSVLTEEFQVVRCDFRGQLQSPGRSSSSFAVHARDVVALLDHLGLKSVHLVGTSFGALVGIALAAEHPERARSLLVVAAAARASAATVESGRQMRRLAAAAAAGGDRRPFQDHMVERVYSPGYRSAHAEELAARRQSLDGLPAAWFTGLDGILASIESYDILPSARQVVCATRVLAAARDTVMPLASARVLAEALRADVVEHPTSGHALVVEDPAWLADRCLDFLRREAESPAPA